jgi:pimeloyl-ACP methyl ester carboxylesterase
MGELREARFGLDEGGEHDPAIFYLPSDAEEPLPLVLIAHPATSSKEDYFVRDAAMMWAPRGMVCGGFDAPHHGERTTGNPLALFQDPELRARAVDQYAAELTAVVDAALALFPADASRMGFVGYSMGSMLGLPAVAQDGRFRAAAFCLVGVGGLGGSCSGPGDYASELGDVAVRVVGKTQDELIPRASTEALYEALPGEKDMVWLPGGHFEIGPDVLTAARDWMTGHLLEH